MLDVVGDVCGIHAQVAASAELSLGLRVDGITREDVRHALWEQRTLVKTYGLRGTLHLFPTNELALWLAAIRSRPPRSETNPMVGQALPPERRGAVLEAIHTALGGRPLTRDELGVEIGNSVGAWATEAVFPAFGGRWPPWQLALGQAALEGLIVFGPNRGNRVSYVRTDQWLGGLGRVDEREAAREVCRRYLAAYGPATHVEFARWFNAPPRWARDLMQSLELEEVDVEGWRAWMPANGDVPEPRRGGAVHLLPHFDCFVVGSHPRAHLVPELAPPELRKGTAAPFAVLLVDGVVGGVWDRQRRGKSLEVRVDAFATLGPEQREQVERQASRIGVILQTPVEVAFGEVKLRAHL